MATTKEKWRRLIGMGVLGAVTGGLVGLLVPKWRIAARILIGSALARRVGVKLARGELPSVGDLGFIGGWSLGGGLAGIRTAAGKLPGRLSWGREKALAAYHYARYGLAFANPLYLRSMRRCPGVRFHRLGVGCAL